MNKYKEFIIVLRGCDDITKVKYLLSDYNLNFLIPLFKNINKNSKDCCKPTIHILKDEGNFKDIDLYNLSDFDDLIGGYYE